MRISGLVGIKLGMTRFFNLDGTVIPVTMVKIYPNHVTQVKSIKIDGYNSVQVTIDSESNFCHLNKPQTGHLMKSGVKFGRHLWEFKTVENSKLSVGDILTIKVFKNINKVDITGFSKGKGFAGTVKRWNFRTQDASHGNSLSHRAPGSIGQNQTPGRVFKGKKMAGQLGNVRVTELNLDLINIDFNSNLLLIKGSIPGGIGQNVIVKKSIKTFKGC